MLSLSIDNPVLNKHANYISRTSSLPSSTLSAVFISIQWWKGAWIQSKNYDSITRDHACHEVRHYGAKGVHLAVKNWSKRSTPFAKIIEQKVYTFYLKNWAKSVLAKKKKKFFWILASTTFPPNIGKKVYTFCSII